MSKKKVTAKPLCDTCVEQCVDCKPFELIEQAVIPEPVRVHVVKDGDSYPSIAGLYKPSDVTKHEYAKHLFDLNKGKTLITGMEVSL